MERKLDWEALTVSSSANFGEGTDNPTKTAEDADRVPEVVAEALAGEGWAGKVTVTIH